MRILMKTVLVTVVLTCAACASPSYDRHAHGRASYYRADYQNIAEAAYRLDVVAEQFARRVRHGRGGGHPARDADRFADAARRFYHQVESGSPYLRGDYEYLAREYVHLRAVFGGHRGSRHGPPGGDLRELEWAFDNLNREIHYAQTRHAPNGWRDRRIVR